MIGKKIANTAQTLQALQQEIRKSLANDGFLPPEQVTFKAIENSRKVTRGSEAFCKRVVSALKDRGGQTEDFANELYVISNTLFMLTYNGCRVEGHYNDITKHLIDHYADNGDCEEIGATKEEIARAKLAMFQAFDETRALQPKSAANPQHLQTLDL